MLVPKVCVHGQLDQVHQVIRGVPVVYQFEINKNRSIHLPHEHVKLPPVGDGEELSHL